MKVAFTACIDAIDDPVQPVWNRIAGHDPDVLVLTGDIAYMDYGLKLPGNRRPLGWPRKVDDAAFAAALYDRYRRQYEVASFRALIDRGVRVGMTWDDHDFAWNDARGAGTEKRYAVPAGKRKIAQALFRQFRQAVAAGGGYPALPGVSTLQAGDEKGIQESFVVGGVQFVMTDGRSFREDPNDAPDADLLGHSQREWLAELLRHEGLTVIASGSTLVRSKESWDNYFDYAWLLRQAQRPTVVLSGDIHRNADAMQHSPFVYEVTASGAARPGLGGNSGNFGLLQIGEAAVTAQVFSRLKNGSSPSTLQFGE